MKTVTYTSLRKNLSSILDEIEMDQEPYYISRKQHTDVVMIARDDYESLIETLHLLSNTKNAKKLLEALEQDRKGEYEKVNLDS